MLTTSRDCKRGGERFAIPTLGEIEGRLLASETVATSCLREFLADSDRKALGAIRRRIRRALHANCEKAKLCEEDKEAAVEYAFQLFDAATACVEKTPRRTKLLETTRAKRGSLHGKLKTKEAPSLARSAGR